MSDRAPVDKRSVRSSRVGIVLQNIQLVSIDFIFSSTIIGIYCSLLFKIKYRIVIENYLL